MAEIEMTLPTVQYGNVKVRLNPEELGASPSDAAAVGAATAVYLNLFTQGWAQGSALDVVADVHMDNPPGDPKAAAARLDAGQKPRTVDEANEMARQVIERELGPTSQLSEDFPVGPEVPDDEPEDDGEAAYDAAYSAPNDGPEPAPWDKKVDAKPKPWEGGGKPTKVATIDWS